MHMLRDLPGPPKLAEYDGWSLADPQSSRLPSFGSPGDPGVELRTRTVHERICEMGRRQARQRVNPPHPSGFEAN